MARERLDLGRHFPLRIVKDTRRDVRELNTPYEVAPNDMATVEYLNGDPNIVLVRLVDTPTPSGYLPFERYMLLSTWKDSEQERQFLLTLSGYEFTDKVEVKAWQDFPDYAHHLEPKQIERMGTVRRLHAFDVMHIQGLEEAIKWHKEIGATLNFEEFPLDFAREVYEAILYTVPR